MRTKGPKRRSRPAPGTRRRVWKRAFLRGATPTVLGALVCSLAACGSSERSPAARPNLLLISIDTLRADHLNSYGYRTRRTSPAIDALAAEGVLFENHIAASSWTTPSHMSLFTGLYPTAHGLTQPFSELMDGLDAARGFNRLGAQHPTLAQLLAERGWTTAAFTGGGTLDPQLGFGRGFGRYETDSYKLDDVKAERVHAWLRAHSGSPFFLFWHSFEVHAPYLRTQFLDEVLPAARAAALARALAAPLDRALADPGHGARDDLIQRGPRLLSAHGAYNRRVTEALYDGGIAEFDRRIAELVSLLRELGIYDRTLIAVTSDHGEEFADHSSLIWDAHGHSLHEELVRVPLILKLPDGLHSGRRVAAVNRNVDVVPTLLRALGVTPEPDATRFQGRPLQPLFDAESEAEPRVAWSEALATQREQKSVRTETHRYIVSIDAADARRYGRAHVPDRPARRQLYDLRSDPHTRIDLMRLGDNPVAESLDALLRDFAAMPEGEVDRVRLEPEAIERLRSLGYIE